MFEERTPVDYKSELPGDKTGGAVLPDLPAVEDWLQRLARAIRQFHTYPPTSPLCTEAVVSCHSALALLDSRNRVSFRVTPHELVVEEVGVGSGTIVEQELVRRLYRAHVSAVAFDRGASLRDLTRFCEDLVRCDQFVDAKTTMADLLVEHGVDAVTVEMAHRPEVLEVGMPRAPLLQLVESERRRRQALPAEGAVSHLYPPDKGWVRLDPASRFKTVSLIDLAILVDDPAEIATMLLRLTDDDPVGGHVREAALEQKFSDVAALFASMEPQLARVMFAKLARAVLDLDPERREDLLRRTILPGLLDGEPAGTVLRDFADVDLAESLCLLLDLETAAPEVLTTALERLDLSSARRDHVVPLLEAQLRTRHAKTPEQESGWASGVDRYARKLIHIEPGIGRSLAEFAAFDLSIDEQAATVLTSVRAAISATDVGATELQCLRSLVKLDPSPMVAGALLGRVAPLLVALLGGGRWSDLASEIAQYRHLAETLGQSRPDVADAVWAALTAFWTPERAKHVADMHGAGADERAVAARLVEASAVTIAPALLTLIDDAGADPTIRGVVALLCEHARLFAPALAPELDQCGDATAHVLVRVLGFAGHGYEKAIAAQLGHRDERTDREALRALVRIGTGKAAAVVAGHLLQGRAAARAAAEEALWHFPPAHTAAQLRDLLARREFVRHHPDVAVRLLDRAAQARPAGLEPALAGLAPFRFWFWNPTLVRVSRKARSLLAQ